MRKLCAIILGLCASMSMAAQVERSAFHTECRSVVDGATPSHLFNAIAAQVAKALLQTEDILLGEDWTHLNCAVVSEELKKMTTLDLSVRDSNDQITSLSLIADVYALRAVKLSGGSLRDDDLRVLASLPNLQTLEIDGLMHSTNFKFLRGAPSLQNLKVKAFYTGQFNVAELVKIETLEVINITNAGGIRGFSSESFQRSLPNLRTVILNGTLYLNRPKSL